VQVKTLVCCDTVDMLGDLWVSMFSAGSIAVVLAVVAMAYIGKLDSLPRGRCCAARLPPPRAPRDGGRG